MSRTIFWLRERGDNPVVAPALAVTVMAPPWTGRPRVANRTAAPSGVSLPGSKPGPRG